MRLDELEKEKLLEEEHYKKINYENIDIYEQPYLFNDMINNVIKNIPDIKNKKIIDLGAGAGILTVLLALQGANVTAIDISKEACRINKMLSAKYKVSHRINVINGTLKNIKHIEKQDYVICLNSLHHMKLDDSVDGIRDILKEGGRIIFIEPLIYNPLAYIHRKYFKNEGRTEGEKPLSIENIRVIKSKFKKVKITGLYLISTIMLMVNRLLKIDERNPISRLIYPILNFIDIILLKIPMFKYLSWKIMMVAEK